MAPICSFTLHTGNQGNLKTSSYRRYTFLINSFWFILFVCSNQEVSSTGGAVSKEICVDGISAVLQLVQSSGIYMRISSVLVSIYNVVLYMIDCTPGSRLPIPAPDLDHHVHHANHALFGSQTVFVIKESPSTFKTAVVHVFRERISFYLSVFYLAVDLDLTKHQQQLWWGQICSVKCFSFTNLCSKRNQQGKVRKCGV